MSEIKEILETEVSLMREILSTMMLEEQALLCGDRDSRKELMSKRQELKRKLLPLRRKKNTLFPSEGENMEELVELSSLNEQLISLSQKIEIQQSQNRVLGRTVKSGLPQVQVQIEPLPPKPNISTLDVEEDS